MNNKHTITILGDGAFGTAFATLLAHNGHEVTLWCNNQHIAQEINATHENKTYLPDITLNASITATSSLEEALHNTIIFQAIPMMFLRSVLEQAQPFFRPDHCFASLTKGIEETNGTLVLATDIIENISNNTNNVVISGPSYAYELASQQPTGFVIASIDHALACTMKELIQNDFVITTISSDPIGLQIVSALKNICALGIGLLEGTGYHNNTQALFIMQLLEEIKTMLHAFKIPEPIYNKTLYGIGGIGDLMLTCFGKSSRNYKFGYARASGTSYDALVTHMGIVPEGVNTLRIVPCIAQKYALHIPLFTALHDIIFKEKTVQGMIQHILD